MDSFIKKVFDKNIDEGVRLQFMKFSRGEFKDRALVSVTKTAKGFSINTGPEYANALVRVIAEKITGEEKIKVTGAIVSTRDLTGEVEFKDKKQFQGVKRYLIDTEMSREEILNLCDNFPKSFLALSFSAGNAQLKIKPKAPKNAKAKNKEEAPKVNFCRLKTPDAEIANGFTFGLGNFKKVNIRYDFIITEIDIPKDIKDQEEMREKSVRRGKIIRKIDIDGNESVKEVDFEI